MQQFTSDTAAQSFTVQLYSNEYRVTGITRCDECSEHFSQCLPHEWWDGLPRDTSQNVAGLNCRKIFSRIRLILI